VLLPEKEAVPPSDTTISVQPNQSHFGDKTKLICAGFFKTGCYGSEIWRGSEKNKHKQNGH